MFNFASREKFIVTNFRNMMPSYMSSADPQRNNHSIKFEKPKQDSINLSAWERVAVNILNPSTTCYQAACMQVLVIMCPDNFKGACLHLMQLFYDTCVYFRAEFTAQKT